MCRFYENPEGCPNGNFCMFAHSEEELKFGNETIPEYYAEAKNRYYANIKVRLPHSLGIVWSTYC